jgi:PAS domain S-box-containing protein
MKTGDIRNWTNVHDRPAPSFDSRFPQSLSIVLRSPVFLELMDCVGDFVLVCDPGLRVLMANRVATAFSGYSERELAAKRLPALLKAEERREMAKFVRETKERRGGEAVFLTRSNKEVLLHFSLSPLTDGGKKPRGYLLVGRLAGEDEPRVNVDPSNGLAKRMLEGFGEPLFIIDAFSRTICECNAAAIAVLGFAREELIGWRLLSHAASEEERERNEALMARAEKSYAKSGIFQERLLFPRKNGPALPCDFISLPIFRTDGVVAFIIAMLFDRSVEEDRDAELTGLISRANSLASDLATVVSGSTRGETRRLSSLGFTQRQIEITRLVALGVSSKDIGSRLGIAESTVRNHLSVIFRKLGVTSRMGFMHILIERRIRIA